MPAASASNPVVAADDSEVEAGGGGGERGGGGGGERAPLPSLKVVPRELLRSFPHSKRVGAYLVGKMINKGSFAKVMEGLHVATGEKVAIKVIDKKKARQDSYVLKNMKREPRIHQMVRHPHIVLLLETLETENSYYMAMELCAGGDLMDRICERRRLEEREVRRYTRQILSAVDHLHQHGIVHRDLKIENFLLDEHNNIKIVDFGLSNTLKVEPLSLDLLTTQCGSPAYAAPELLAHRKYGPKVDVWSVALPPDGAEGFVLSLLEADPANRPSIRNAMEDRWINEGYAKKPFLWLSAEELDSSVLSYMTEALGYAPSDVLHTLTNNRPSAIMASYHLLLAKLCRGQKAEKKPNKQKLSSNDWSLPSRNTWRGRNSNGSKTQPQNEAANESVNKQQAFRPLRSQTQRRRPEGASRRDRGGDHDDEENPGISDEEIAITVDMKEVLFPEVSMFGDRELAHGSPPTKLSCYRDNRLTDNRRLSGNERLEKLQTFYSVEKAELSPRMLLEAEAAYPPERGGRSGGLGNATETARTSPPATLPRLRNVGPKGASGGGGGGRKLTWVGLTRPGPPGLLVNGSKPPTFSSQRQHALVIKSLRQERGKRAGEQ
ncbi:hypothetical protein NHX12_025845, partial [Muraenolepis orangiensis]